MKSKKLALIALTSVSSLILSTSISFADSEGIITGTTVRMREEPSTSAKIIDNLDEDKKVNVIEKDGEWYKISIDGKEGYVFGEYLKVKNEVKELAEEPTKEEPKETEEKQNESTSEKTNEIEINSIQKLQKNSKLYALPLLSSKVISELKTDSEVMVMQTINNWIYIKQEGKTGWLLKQNIQVAEKQEVEEKTEEEATTEEAKEETTETSTSEAKVGYVNVENANVRQKPTTDSEHIATLTINKEVTILGEENNWYKIEVGNKQGYIYKKLVSDEKVKEPTSRSSEDRTIGKNESNIASENQEVASSSGESVVSYAMQYLGSKYVSGGNGPSAFDCSGFTSYVYKHFGYSLSRTSGGQASNGSAVDKSDLQKGDIVVFLNDGKSSVGHVGIYIGDNTFVHAANPSKGVVTESMSSSYYSQRYVTARRIIE